MGSRRPATSPWRFEADLSDEAQVIATIGAATSNFGGLHILHNNAALTDSDFLTRDTAVTDLSLEVWQRTMEVNLQSQMLTCKHAVPEMVRGGGGSIINMSSGASLKGDRTRTAYGVSKAGVNALSMYVATSHGKQGIRVNTILPGLIITDAVRAHLDEKMVANLGKAVLTRSVGQPDDIADVVVFLASDESRYITGQMIAVDGGMGSPRRTRETAERRLLKGPLRRRAEDVVARFGMVVPATTGVRPAVDVDRLAGDVARHVAGQEDGGSCHFVDVAGPAHGHGEAEAPAGVRAQWRRCPRSW